VGRVVVYRGTQTFGFDYPGDGRQLFSGWGGNSTVLKYELWVYSRSIHAVVTIAIGDWLFAVVRSLVRGTASWLPMSGLVELL